MIDNGTDLDNYSISDREPTTIRSVVPRRKSEETVTT